MGETFFSATLLVADPICGDGVHPILKTSRNHGIWTVREYEIGRVADNVCPFERQCTCNLWEKPVKAYHNPNPSQTDVPDLKVSIPRGKPQFFFIKEVGFSVDVNKSFRSDQDG